MLWFMRLTLCVLVLAFSLPLTACDDDASMADLGTVDADQGVGADLGTADVDQGVGADLGTADVDQGADVDQDADVDQGATQCSGTPNPCGSYTMINVCEALPGCSYDANPAVRACVGTQTSACSDAPDESSCRIAGCDWD